MHSRLGFRLTSFLCALVCTTVPALSGIAASKEIPTVTIVAADYEFRGPDRIPAGLTTIEIVNAGEDLHHVQLVQLAPGKSLADFNAEFKATSKLPPWVRFAGGPNAVVPGERAIATVNLDPADYLLLCLIPTETGAPHFILGMVKPLQVMGPAMKVPPMPTGGTTIRMLDFGFGIVPPITAGTHAIHVRNDGDLPHEVVVVQLTPDTSINDFGDFAAKRTGPPPGKPMGGMVGLDGGREGSFTATFQPGKYGIICFFPDPDSGAPHFRRGMLSEFTVE